MDLGGSRCLFVKFVGSDPQVGEIMVHGGSYVEPLNMKWTDIAVEWVAHSTANLCRYTGHTHRPTWGSLPRRAWRWLINRTGQYSVAQHAVLVSLWLEIEGYSTQICFDGLHHDSTESVFNDFASPVKRMMPEYKKAENRAYTQYAYALGLSEVEPKIVKHADRLMCSTEQRDLMLNPQWPGWPEPWARRIEPWTPAKQICVE